MWAKRPRGQLEKCAEAAALRRAFPEEIGNEYAAEEVEGQAFNGGRDSLPTQSPNLAARLAAPTTAPTEGFNANGLDPNDHIPDFDAEASPSETASEQPAPDTPPPSGAGNTSTNESGSAFDVIQWADKLIDDLPFLRPDQIETIENDRKEIARFTLLKSTDMAKAQELEAAINAAKEG